MEGTDKVLDQFLGSPEFPLEWAFAVDWLAKNVNGYLYTAAIPANPTLEVNSTEYGSRYWAPVPADPAYLKQIGAYLDRVLPVYGEHFADWWYTRLVPETRRNFAHLEESLDRAGSMSLMELACLLEDAIDIHDRQAQTLAALNSCRRPLYFVRAASPRPLIDEVEAVM